METQECESELGFKNEAHIKTLEGIKRYFLSRTKPAKGVADLLTKLDLAHLQDEEFQQSILSETIDHPIAISFPLDRSYQKIFLRTVINLLENYGIEISGSLYKKYTDLLQEEEFTEEFTYKTYLLADKAVTLKESVYFISENTTGLHAWEAGKQLAEWCLVNKTKFSNKIILELGCGVGLTGIVICTLCKPAKYIFTDCDEKVLEVIRHNIVINSGNWDSRRIETLCLDWNSDFIFMPRIDWVLAADVTYDPSYHAPLCKIIKAINPVEGTIVAAKERDPQTEEKFTSTLKTSDLDFEKLVPVCPVHFLEPLKHNFFLYKISKRKL